MTFPQNQGIEVDPDDFTQRAIFCGRVCKRASETGWSLRMTQYRQQHQATFREPSGATYDATGETKPEALYAACCDVALLI